MDLIDTESTGMLGEDIPFLSGQELAVELKKATITVSVEGDRIRAAIGPKVDGEKFFKNKNWAEWKKFCEEEAGGKTMSEVSGLMKEMLPMKWAVAVEGSAGICGFLEGSISKNGDTIISGGLNIQAAISAGLKAQYAVGVVPVYAKVSLGAEGAIDGAFAYNWTQRKIDAAQTGIFFVFEPALTAEGGIGVVDVLSVGVEGRGSLPFSTKLGSIEDSGLSVKGHLALKAKLLNFEYSKKFAEAEWQLLPWEGAQAGAAGLSLPGLDDFEVSDVGYLQGESLWLGCNYAQAFSAGGAGADSVEQILKTNINPDADVQIVDAGGTEMILWTEGDAARSAINNSKLVYSVYDEEKGTWSEPAAVADDGTADFSPAAVSDGEHVYVAWQNISREFEDNAALSDYAAASAIVMSTWTAGEGFSEAVTVSREGGMAAAPKVALNAEGSPYVAYLQNTENDPLLAAGKNNIFYSVVKGDNVEHKTFVADAGLVAAISTAYTDDYEVSYMLDTDGSLSTLDDREIVTKGTKDAATKNSAMDSGVKYIKNGGKDFRFWYREDAIVMSDAGGKETIAYQDE